MDVASTSRNGPRRKGYGRRKIEMKKIENQPKLWISFSKRKKSLLKKAEQLSKLSGEEIGVIIISEQGRIYTSDIADVVLQHYLLSQETIKDDDDDDIVEKAGNRKVVDDHQGRFWWSQTVDIEKINAGKKSLEDQVNEDWEDLKFLKEMKGKNCLIDLNKAPDDEQFS
ncbi:hypothetical protein REPUB_Repub05bG0087600 [Reevesia pubescens]